jgi:tetratricopeptide (TPR) repeat protein
LGNVAFWRDWDWKTTEREFQAALRANPSNPDAHHDQAWLLVALGRKAEALGSLQRAIALDPLSARTNMDAAWLLLQAGRFGEAAAQARRTLELNPEMKEAHSCLSRALLYAGDDRGALDVIRPEIEENELRAIAELPPAKAIRKLFEDAIQAKPTMDPYQRAWRLAWMGSPEEALAALEESFRTRSSMMPLVAVDPAFMSLQSEERFRKIVRDMGL